MKNAYLLLGGLLLGTFSSFGQLKSQDFPLHTQLDYAESLNEIPDAQAKPSSNSAEVVSSSVIRGGGGALWEEDFGNGFPAGWVSDDASGINPWKWSMNGSHGNFNATEGADYDDPILSTTAANGFLINDPDSANHAAYGQPSGTTYQYLDSYFATTKIDLGATYPSLLLEFQQSFRKNNTVDLVVQVSTDSTNWTDYTVQGNVANNAASDDPDLVSMNISGTVGASQTLFLRIGWSARVYFWMIDDMRIVEGLNTDLAMTDVWHGDIVNSLEYQQIPLAQAHELVIGAACINLGGTAQANAMYTYDVSTGSTSVASGSFAASNTSITSTGKDTTWYATGFVPSSVGDYTVTVSVDVVGDELLSNNEAESMFKMTDNIFTHDDEDNIEFQISGGENDNMEANEYKIAMFYETYANGTLRAVQTAFGNNTTTTSCIVEVFDAVNDQNLSNPLVTEVYDLVAGDISAGAVPTLVNILLNDGDGIDLVAGGVYLISIGNTGEGEELWFLASDGDEDEAQRRYGPFGTGNAINWYRGYTTSPTIRANFDPTVGIAEASLQENGFGIYPNPASNNVVIQFDNSFEAEAISITDITGKIVSQVGTTANSSSMTIDVSTLSSGVYFVNVESAKGMNTQKLIIE